MIIRSDWHMHSEASHDSSLTLDEIVTGAAEYGFLRVGVTDHVNLNDALFLSNLRRSVNLVTEKQKTHPELVLGVELTPIEQPEFDYIARNGSNEGYVPPKTSSPYPIALAVTKEEMIALGVRYAIGASHWRVDLPYARKLAQDLDASIREWYRQQLFMARDERVTVLGHPWYHGYGIWYEDFTRIPRSMNEDIMAALKENKKYVECNSHFFNTEKATEKFKHQYAEFLRECFERGIPVTYGSDAHNHYKPDHIKPDEYLRGAGFVEGEIGGIREEDLW